MVDPFEFKISQLAHHDMNSTQHSQRQQPTFEGVFHLLLIFDDEQGRSEEACTGQCGSKQGNEHGTLDRQVFRVVGVRHPVCQHVRYLER